MTAETNSRPASRPTLGVMAMLGTTVLIPLMGLAVKWLHDLGLGALVVMGVRSGGALLLLLPFLLLRPLRQALVRADKRAHFWHALFGLSSMTCFYYGLGQMQLVAVTAINFTTPMFVMLLAIPFLGERPDWQSWAAAFAGLVGAVLVMDLSADSFEWAGVIVLLGSLLTAFMLITIRRMPSQSTHFAVLFYYAAVGFVVFPVLAALTATPVEMAALSLAESWLWLIGLIVVAVSMQFLLTLAYRLARSSSIAAMDYFRLIWAGLIGWLIFAETPDTEALIGMTMIVASGLVLVGRQHHGAAPSAGS